MTHYLHVHEVLRGVNGANIVENIDIKNDRVDLCSLETGSKTHVTISQLRREMADGFIRSDDQTPIAGTVRRSGDHSSAYKTFLFRIAVVKRIKAAVGSGKSVGQAIADMKGALITTPVGNDHKMCSPREAYRLMKLAAVSESALMPAYECRGNRKPRYGERMSEIVQSLVRDLYAVKKSRIIIGRLRDLVIHSARAEGILAEKKR